MKIRTWSPLLAGVLWAPALFAQDTGDTRGDSSLFLPPEEPNKNRVSFSARALFNVSVRIQGMAGSPPPPGPGGPTQTARFYDDGFVGVDSTGNAGGVTSFWRYENASQYDPAGAGGDGSIAMHHSSFTAPGNRMSDDPHPGLDFTYSRDLWEVGRGRVGLELGTTYAYIGLHDRRSFNATATTTEDLFSLGGAEPLDPGVTGNFERGGGGVGGGSPLLDELPFERNTVTETLLVDSRDRIHAHLLGTRLGPFYQYLFGHFGFQISAGVVCALLQDEIRNTMVITSSGGTRRERSRDSDWKILAGPYAAAQFQVYLSEEFSFFLGGQWQNLGDYVHKGKRQRVEYDFHTMIYAAAGFTYSF